MGNKVVGDERKQLAGRIRAAYAAGESIRAIAERIGRSYGFVHRALNEEGVSFRPRGGARVRSARG